MKKISLIFLSVVLGAMTAQAKNTDSKKILSTDEHVPHELIVKFKSESVKSTLLKFSAAEKKSFKSSGAKLLSFPSVLDLKKTMASLKENPNVEYVEYNQVYKLMAVPDDAEYSKLYGMDNMSMPDAWDEHVGSRNVVAAVIDTGIDYNHVDLRDNYWNNPGEVGLDADGNDKSTNGIDDDMNGYVDDFRGWDFINGDNDPMDGHGHGTHCAGTIGAVGNNGIGVAGVNWEVSLVGIKIFSDSGRTTAEAIIEAIEYSTRLGVDVTNNSWGGGAPNEAIRAAISEANDAGILFVAAAGNSSANNDTGSFYPANYDLENIISVAAVDSNDRLARFSNYGKRKVHVAAPGVSIYSTKNGGGYQNMSGTSMAAPHITGLAAYIISRFPEDSMSRVKRRIIYTGDAVDALSDRLISGKRANAVFSIQEDDIAPAPVSDLVITDRSMSSVEISFSVSGDDGVQGEASEYEARVHSEPITMENWEEATRVSADVVISEAGEVSFSLENLDLNSRGYLAVRASDDIGNLSEISESIEYSTLEVEVLAEDDADSLEGTVVDGTWGLEVDSNENSMFSDSPDGEYGNNLNDSLVLPAFEVSTEKTFLNLITQYNLESGFDYGYVELSTDGETWTEVSKFNGASGGFVSSVIDLTDAIGEASTYQIRFRITSDGSVTQDGWKIDRLSILGNVPE